MKKYILLFSFTLLIISGYSQIYVGDVNINKKQGVEFVELVGITKNFNITVHVDYGQQNPKEEEIRDKGGKIARSSNIISALNLMTENGWKFVNSYGYGTNSENTVVYLLMKEK